MLNQKENYLRTLHHQIPEYIPKYTFGILPGDPSNPPNCILEPEILADHRWRGGGKDHWGVEYISSPETAGALIPKTWDYILPDITKWRDVIKAPSLEGIDWEAMAKKSIDHCNVNREETAIALNLHFGFFQNLMAFMGFEDGLMMFYEEPEEVEELLDYICTFYCTVCEKIIDYVKPDVYTMMDDTASALNMFISPDMYREFLVPCYKRQAKFGIERGLPITFHNCGHCEAVIPDMVDFGVTAWDPAQPMNNLKKIKADYAGRLTINGGWHADGRLLSADCTDEEIRQSVYDTVNMLAPNGDFCWMGSFMGTGPKDTVSAHKNKVLSETFEEIRYTFYK